MRQHLSFDRPGRLPPTSIAEPSSTSGRPFRLLGCSHPPLLRVFLHLDHRPFAVVLHDVVAVRAGDQRVDDHVPEGEQPHERLRGFLEQVRPPLRDELDVPRERLLAHRGPRDVLGGPVVEGGGQQHLGLRDHQAADDGLDPGVLGARFGSEGVVFVFVFVFYIRARL